jgi:small-conductance mechanosensitive channel
LHSVVRNSRPLTKVSLLTAVLVITAGMVAAQTQGGAASSPPSNTPKPPGAQEIMNYLNQTIGWYRHLPVEQQLADAGDLAFLEDDRTLADQIVRLSFDFAKAQAESLAKAPVSDAALAGQGQDGAAPSSHQHLVDLGARAETQVRSSQEELERLRQKLAVATGRRRKELQSAVAETQSELELAKARRDVMRSMVEFMSDKDAGGTGVGGLRSQIEELEKTVPALAEKGSGATPAGATTGHAAAASVVPTTKKTVPYGILGLTTDLISLSGKIRTLDETIRQTDALAQAAKNIRTPLGAGMRELTQRGDQLANQPESSDRSVLAQQKTQLDELTGQFKERSAAILPLVKQRILLDLYKRSLTNWRDAIRTQHTSELKSLIVRLALLGIVLALVLGSANLWRRAIFRYVQDPRRRYQLLLVQRIAVWFSIALVIAFAFATELGSLATFAGLLTAGIAVALQNVILSIAGYFFLIGKYGVRVGDRVQIAGVTAEVVDIGLVRLHLMELAGAGTDAQPTGRVVVFSNSVVFQPTAGMFKQIPGTSFVWHEITLTLAADSDYRSVEERLLGAVERVFAEYRDAMETQRRRIEKTLASVSVRTLGPQSRLRLTQSGLEVVIRYPLELANAARIDDRITRELLDAIEREPKLKLVGTGTPNIQPVAEGAAVS